MKKNLIILLAVVSVLALAAAVTVGQVISQDQLDNLNVSDQDLDEHFLRDEFNKVDYKCYLTSGTRICDFYVVINTLTPEYDCDNETGECNATGNYVVTSQTHTLKERASTWSDLMEATNKTYAISILKEKLKLRRDKKEAETKRDIAKLQTPDEQVEANMDSILTDLDL